MKVELLPNNKRLKQLRKEHGKFWNVIERRDNVLCFTGPGIRIKSLDGKHERWVRPEDINEKE